MIRTLCYFLLLFPFASNAQDSEFGETGNGLIYSNATIGQLKKIVDSLNIKFRVCELNKTYYSKSQTIAHYISLKSGDIKAAKSSMEAHIPFDDFINKFNDAEIEKNRLLIKFRYKNYFDKEIIEFSNIGIKNVRAHRIEVEENPGKYDGPLKGKWLIDYWPGSQHVKESLSAFYVLEDFSPRVIPEKYARLIQYSDCMVDTTVEVFYDNAKKSGGRYYEPPKANRVSTFMNYINTVTGQPAFPKKFDEKSSELYRAQMDKWEKDKIHLIISAKNTLAGRDFDSLLLDAVNEALQSGVSNDKFEEIVEAFYSKKTALELKRMRNVVGACSMDDRPRVHAFNIALLSAETVNWEIFLRCHLNIMNDRFERSAESSFAKARRNTYIKELEVLDINVLDLLLGISLRFENANENHYYGSIDRLGRALAETRNPGEIEARMLQMIADKSLDDYNRVLIYYLFLNYNSNLKQKKRQNINEEKLEIAVNTLPVYLIKD